MADKEDEKQLVSIRCSKGLVYHNTIYKLMGKYSNGKHMKEFYDLGCAENKLMEDVISEKMLSGPAFQWKPHHRCYGGNGGTPEFKMALAEHLEKRFSSIEPISPSNICVYNGCCTLLQMLAQTLADSGEYFLVPTPYYRSLERDFGLGSGVKICRVPLLEKEPGDDVPFQLTCAKLERAYQAARKEGKVIRAIVLMNPHNPLGVVYSRELVKELLQWASTHQLHFISDEIYGMTVFGQGKTFDSSVLSVPWPDPQRVHLIWGFSKDLGLSGLRCGVLYSKCEAFRAHFGEMSIMHCVPSIIQDQLTYIMKDNEWLDGTFFPTLREQLFEKAECMRQRFEDMGAKVLPPQSCVYLWVNFSKFLKPHTPAGELALNERFLKNGVCLFPGSQYFCSSPGWFRIVFAVNAETMENALTIMQQVLVDLPADGFTQEELSKASVDMFIPPTFDE